VSVNLAVNYVADYKDISRETSGIINGDDYAVLDVAADYQFNRRWRLFGRVENATDEHYEPADGFQAPDRGLYAGAELKL
jgi:outer membrane cobalamin receptor